MAADQEAEEESGERRKNSESDKKGNQETEDAGAAEKGKIFREEVGGDFTAVKRRNRNKVKKSQHNVNEDDNSDKFNKQRR